MFVGQGFASIPKAPYPRPVGKLRIEKTSRPEWTERIIRVAESLGHPEKGTMGILAWREKEDNYLCVFRDEGRISVHLPSGVGMGRGCWVATLVEV